MPEPIDSSADTCSPKADQHFVQLMTDLFASPLIREEFVNAPEKLLSRYDLTESEKRSLGKMDIKQVQKQSNSLIRKRWHAITKLIPKTVGSGSLEEIRGLFEFYATRNWPSDFRRHIVDAYEFILFLEANELPFADQEEKQRLRRMLG